MTRPLVTLVLICAAWIVPARAQDTTLIIDLIDQHVRIGDTVRVPVIFSNTSTEDSVPGYSLDLILSESGLVEFNSARYFDTVGTLCSGWAIGGQVFPPGFVRVVGLADDFPLDGILPPIPAGTVGQTLIVIIGYMPCMIHPFGDYEVDLVQGGAAQFSDTHGELITPVAVHSATITIQPPVRGDVDQSEALDVLDVIRAISCAFRNDCPGCDPLLADVDCSGEVDVVDVVSQIDVIFRDGSPPGCVR